MREKIAAYLEKAGRPLSAEQILREVLNIRSPNSFAADKVLRGILGPDPQFRENQGLWYLAAKPTPRLADIAGLHLQWEARRPGCFRGAVCLPEAGLSWEFWRTETSKPSDYQALREARLTAEKRLLLVWNEGARRQWNRILRSNGLPAWADESLSLSRLAARLLPQAHPFQYLEDLASVLDQPPPDMERPAAVAQFLCACFQTLIDRVPGEHRTSLAELQRWIDAGSARVDFTRFAFDRDLLARIPESPGIYLMRNRGGEVIYVGKADNLRRRVRSYFTPRALKDAKVAKIHSQLYSLEFSTCATEVEALLLEMRMIRDFRPVINLQTEIHERPSRYGHARNLLLLVPAGTRVEIYLLSRGAFVGRLSVPFGRAPSKRLCSRIRTTYFGARRGKPANVEEWEDEIVARWLSANKKRLNFVDVDEAGSMETVLRQLTSYLMDPDRLARKVYYR